MSRTLAVLLASCLFPFFILPGVLLYAYCLEPRWIEETHWELRAENWRGRPLRLAVLADLHARPEDGDYLDDIVRRTLAARPDVILLLGDYVNNPLMSESMDVETLGRHLSPLMQVPCFAVLGNHDEDFGAGRVRNMLRSIGVHLLEGSIQALPIGGDTLHLGGIRHVDYYELPQKLRQPLPDASETFILISHAPPGKEPMQMGHTATLCAHRHGGQICLPGGIPLTRINRYIPRVAVQGEERVEGKRLYITRGLGMSQLCLRLFSRPELLFVELLPGGQG